MKLTVVVAALASISAVYGHATFQYAWKNGVDLGAGIGSYIRGPSSNSPVKDVKSKDIICNTNNSHVPRTIEVVSGDVLTLEWQHDNRRDDIIDPTHKGPAMVYVAPAASNGVGAVWNKIFDQGFSGGSWAVDKLIAAKGTVSITVPDLAAGEYLIRPEIIALHESDTDFAINPARGAQFYMGCMQIKVVSSGSVKLTSGIDFQKDYRSGGTGILFNLYGSPGSSYVSPGGPVASFAAAGAGIGPVPPAGSKPSTTAAGPTTTAKPASSALSTTKMTTVTIRTSTASPSPTNPSGATVAKYGQCGGIGFTGPKVCAPGSTCKFSNDWYSQCL